MNQETEHKPTVTPDQIIGEVLLRAEPFRVQAMRVLSFIGLLAASIASADLTGVLPIFPDHLSGWLLSAGLFAASLKQAVLWIGDWLDNGRNDNSFKLGLWMFCMMAVTGLFMTSCGVTVTEDGCLLGSFTKDGQTYQAGPCVGADVDNDGSADVNRFRVVWKNQEGQVLRVTYWTKDKKPALVEYQTGSGIWLQWDSKSGILIGPTPPEVQSVLAGQPKPVELPILTKEVQ